MLVIVGLAAACFGEDLPSVDVEQVGAGRVTQTVSAPARVEAAAAQEVSAGVSGVVVSLQVSDGQRVDEGDIVLRLSSEQVDLAREQAQAAESAAGGTGIAVPGGGDATLAAAYDAVRKLDASTKPELADARAEAERIDDRRQRTAALAAVAAIDASYEATRAALLSSGQTLAAQQDATAAALSSALSQAMAAAAESQRLQAEAAAASAEEQGDNLVVRAPFDGVVELGSAASAGGPSLPSGLAGEAGGGLPDIAGALGGGGGTTTGSASTLRVGAPVAAGQTLFMVYDLSERYVAADIDEVDAPQVGVDQRAEVRVDAFGDVTFTGVVERVALTAETTETGGVGYPVRVRLLGTRGAGVRPVRRLKVGMTASAEITTRQVRSDLVVPSRALLRRGEADVVFVVVDDRVEAVEVEILGLGEERAAVRGDLEPDDVVVVSGYEDLVAGDEVTVAGD